MALAVAPINCPPNDFSTSTKRLIKAAPVLFVFALFVWAYIGSFISCIVQYQWIAKNDIPTAVLHTLAFHFVWLSSVASYVLTMRIGAGVVQAKPPTSDLEVSFRPSNRVNVDTRDSFTMIPLLASYDKEHRRNIKVPIRDSLDDRDSEEEGMELLESLTVKTERRIERKQYEIEDVRDGCVMVKSNGTGRYCKKCQVPKPDRAHHCSTCNNCFLRLDHHCPWTGGCIGLHNYKQFLLFIFYSSLMSLYSCYLGASTLFDYINNTGVVGDLGEFKPLIWALLAVSGGAIGLTIGGFTIYHISLLLRNITTIEAMERSNPIRVRLPTLNEEEYPPWAFKADHMLTRAEREALLQAGEKWRIYDLGWKKNFLQVFGRDWKFWLFPINRLSPLDGYTFPVNNENFQRLQEITKEIRLN